MEVRLNNFFLNMRMEVGRKQVINREPLPEVLLAIRGSAVERDNTQRAILEYR